MSDLPPTVDVYLDSVDLGAQFRVGALRRAGEKVDSPIAFSYDSEWINSRAFFLLDPSHYPTAGDQYPSTATLAGIFTDTSPDRWGRILLDRREASRAHSQGRRPRTLGEWDYLLGVNDMFRMGALRYKMPNSDGYLDAHPTSVPPMADLRELENAARDLERPGRRGERETSEALRLLLAPGSPLGGARPKTSFEIGGELWLAKFPSRNDQRDVGAWEYVLNILAERAAIVVPEVRVKRLGRAGHTFLARRFDRRSGRRLYASAMTLIGEHDRDPASYTDIAEAIERFGAPDFISDDLAQLFRRAVFNIASANRDDHLRNHGFLRAAEGWRLAPAFDLNPTPEKADHELAIGLGSHEPDLELCISELAPLCRLAENVAQRVTHDVIAAIQGWETVARQLRIPSAELDLVGSVIMESSA